MKLSSARKKSRLLEIGLHLGRVRGRRGGASRVNKNYLGAASDRRLADKAIKQAGLLDRFDQVGLYPKLLQFGGMDGLPQGGQHDQARAGKDRVGFDRRRQGKAIHPGHLRIQERQLIRLTLSDGGSQSSRASVPLAALPTCIFHAASWLRRI